MTDLEFLAQFPAHRALLENVLACYEPDQRVLGLMLYGSLAEDRADIFSDIDLNLLSEPEHQAALIGEAPGQAASFGNLLHSFHGPDDPTQFYAYYDCNVKLDLSFMLPGQMGFYAERRTHRIFKDTTGEFSEVVRRAGLLPYRYAFEPEELLALDARFWIMCLDAATKAARGELWRARDVLEEVRAEVLTRLAAWLDGVRPTGYRRIEARISPRWLEGWPATVAVYDRVSILSGAAALVACYTELRAALAAQHAITFNDASERQVRNRLIELGVPLSPSKPGTINA